jgi:hypothetical protein
MLTSLSCEPAEGVRSSWRRVGSEDLVAEDLAKVGVSSLAGVDSAGSVFSDALKAKATFRGDWTLWLILLRVRCPRGLRLKNSGGSMLLCDFAVLGGAV